MRAAIGWLAVAGCPWITAAEQAARLEGAPDTSAAPPPADCGPPHAACRGDRDGDGIPDRADPCPDDPVGGISDTDDDGVGDACDVCPWTGDPDQADADGDGRGDACSGWHGPKPGGDDDHDSDDD